MQQVGKSNWYLLSDGSKVQGKAKAEAAEAALQGGSTSGNAAAVYDPDFGTVAQKLQAEKPAKLAKVHVPDPE